MNGVQRAWVHGCRAPLASACFLEVSGATSAGITLRNNELRGAAKQLRSCARSSIGCDNHCVTLL